MGEVYRARDAKLHRDVAVKVLPEHLATDRDRLARFEREAQMLASLNHPHIAQIYGLEESGGSRALILELVEGETLAEQIGRGPIPLDDAIVIAKQIVGALEAAHEQGIVHRDLKPANIKITPAGVVKVLDFGLAKLADSAAVSGSRSSHSISPTLTSPAMTGVGTILGTAAYMSPEQAKGRPADKRSDVWAFGCVLFEMLTGRRAFAGEDVTDTLASILKGQPDWTALPAEVPPTVRILLQRCLEKDRTARVGDISAARFALEHSAALTSDMRPVATPLSGDSMVVSRRHVRRTRARWLVGAFAAAVVLNGVTGVLVWYAGRTTSPRVTRFEIVPPASAPLGLPLGVNVAVSPDGSTIVYHAQPGGVLQLFVRRIDEIEARPIPGTELGTNPFFSPDGSRVGYVTPTQLRTVALSGGPATTVTNLRGLVQGATWAGDVIIFAQASAGIFRVSATGGQPERIAKPDSAKQENDYRWPEVLPGGKAILYSVYGAGGTRQARVVARRLDTQETRLLVEGANHPHLTSSGYLVWGVTPATLMAAPFDADALSLRGAAVPVVEGLSVVKATGATNVAIAGDGTLVYVSGAGGVFSSGVGFQWLDRSGRAVGSVASKIEGPRYPRLSPDGRSLAVTIGPANQGQIWVIDVAGASQPRELTFKGHNVQPVWSPDSKQIAFTSDVEGQRTLFRIAADGSVLEPTRMTTGPYQQVATAWAGEWLLYEEVGPMRTDLMRLNVKTGVSEPFVQTEFDEAAGSFSPDGSWVSYVTDQTGRAEVWLRPFPGPGAPIRLSVAGGQEPRWSRDGRELFFQSGRKMMTAEVVPGGAALQFKPPRALFEGGFAPFDVNVPRTYDVASDGRFLTIQEDQLSRQASIVVVQNWFEELKRLAPAK